MDRVDGPLLVVGVLAALLMLALLVPWLRADPPSGLTVSNSPYTDEGLYATAARNFVQFGSFGSLGDFFQLSNSGYTLATTAVFAVTGPTIVAARALSIAASAATVLISMWGLAGPLGRKAAVLAGAGLGGCQLFLLYGRVGTAEPLEMAVLVAAFVAMIRSVAEERWALGAMAGVLMAGALTVKANAALALPGILVVPSLPGLVRAARSRDWSEARVPLAASAGFVLVMAVWFLAVVIPNYAEFRTGLKVQVSNVGSYPHSVNGFVTRLFDWLRRPSGTDHALAWTAPLLVGATASAVLTLLLRRHCSAAHKLVVLSGWTWALVAWAVPILGQYDPNRYFLIAIPGLAMAAAPGLAAAVEWVAERIGATSVSVVGCAALVLMLAVPGVFSYLQMEVGVLGTNQLARDTVAMRAAVPDGAVVYGIYAPEVLLPSRDKLVIPWPPAGLHMADPVAKYGVSFVIVDVSSGSNYADSAILHSVSIAGRPLVGPIAEVPWGPHVLALYRISPPKRVLG